MLKYPKKSKEKIFLQSVITIILQLIKYIFCSSHPFLKLRRKAIYTLLFNYLQHKKKKKCRHIDSFLFPYEFGNLL